MSKVQATELLQRIARVGGRALGADVLARRAGSAARSRSGSPTSWWNGSTRR